MSFSLYNKYFMFILLTACYLPWQGLVQTFADNWPHVEHRIYCRHLYNNLRKQHLGFLIKDLFWRAAKATYAQEFERLMNEMKVLMRVHIFG